MRLFAVRLIKDKQAVGFFWATDAESLWWMVDAVCDPGGCEFHRVRNEAAITWPGKVRATLGGGKNFTDEDEATGESKAINQLRTEISFDFALEDYLYATVEGGWIKLPFADEPGGGVHQIVVRETARKTSQRKKKKK
jgi:hypothetical protein